MAKETTSKVDQLRAMREANHSRGSEVNPRKINPKGGTVKNVKPSLSNPSPYPPPYGMSPADSALEGIREFTADKLKEMAAPFKCPVCEARRQAKRLAMSKWRKNKQSS